MSKEQKLFYLATTTSNALGIESELAGHETTKFESEDDGAHVNGTQAEFLHNILVFADILTTQEVGDIHNFDKDELKEARALVKKLRGYDPKKLAEIVSAHWAEQEEEAEA